VIHRGKAKATDFWTGGGGSRGKRTPNNNQTPPGKPQEGDIDLGEHIGPDLGAKNQTYHAGKIQKEGNKKGTPRAGVNIP